MAFDFPSSPTIGDTYVAGGLTYVWNGYAWTSGAGAAMPGSPYVLKAGDTMTGFLTLNADPVDPLHAATKQALDAIPTLPVVPVGSDGQALVAQAGAAVWGAPIDGGNA